MRTLGGFCLVLLLWSMPAVGRDIFVDNTVGNDRFAGRQPRNTSDQSGPVRTIAQALRLAATSDSIVLAKTEQPYHESISLVGARSSGSARQPFTIRGNGAILDGSVPVPPAAWENHAGPVFRFRPSQIGQNPTPAVTFQIRKTTPSNLAVRRNSLNDKPAEAGLCEWRCDYALLRLLNPSPARPSPKRASEDGLVTLAGERRITPLSRLCHFKS